jgi:bifunctional UDP-N-acetylglucosamine pyrophosphorylase/glucosamine-1-phosphate N-acetyltransferase
MAAPLLQAIVLAAGKSSRFRTTATKLSFALCGQEMILYPLKLLQSLAMPITLVVGHQKEVLYDIIQRAQLDSVSFVEQPHMRGTGNALECSRHHWAADHILVMNGDMPLIHEQIIKNLIEQHITRNAAITFITAYNIDPSLEGYGRVVKENNKITSIIEARDFKGDYTTHCLVNAGIYLFKRSFLQATIEHLPVNPTTGEIYITDLIALANKQEALVATVTVPFDTIRGVNTLKELWTAEHIKRSELIGYWMDHGVRFAAAQNTYIDVDITIGSGTFIGAGAHILKGSRIGRDCHIDTFSTIANSIIHDNVIIHSHSIIRDAEVHSHAQVGPFAHLRNHTVINQKAVVGNFVEITKSSLGAQSKAKHLSYLGNAQIGSGVNIGAGTITCNYDGFTKHTTVIEDNVHIGSNNALVAPIVIGKESITGAGSVITKDVPEGALALARAHQINKEGYAQHLRKRYLGALKSSSNPISENI